MNAGVPVDVIVPTLGRPASLAPLLDSLEECTPAGCARIQWVVDIDDHESQAAASTPRMCVATDLLERSGTYPEKINAGARATEAPLILPTADDVVFKPGWYEEALALFTDDVDVVGTNDLTPSTRGRNHATMPIVRRSYVEDPGAAWAETGTVFHEGYHHSYVETELCQLADLRGVWAFAELSMIEHRHHAWGTRQVDDTDRKGNMQHIDRDRDLFRDRKALWTAP